MTEQKIDRNKLTFSQAASIDPLPQPSALGELPKNARNLLWSHIYEYLRQRASADLRGNYSIQQPWSKILYDYHVQLLLEPADEFSTRLKRNIGIIKPLFISGEYNRIFDFLQFVLRHKLRPNSFYDDVESVLKDCMCAYTVVDDGPTIVPIALPEQRESTNTAFQVLASGPFEGARSHLHESARCINKGDPAGSVRESIHAVESVARRLDANATTSLKPALDALNKKVVLHHAFRKGIENLYGYTNDNPGIRHALNESGANVDLEDAVFMFGACAAFSAYLVNKARRAGLSIEL